MTCDPVPTAVAAYDALIADMNIPTPDLTGVEWPNLPSLNSDTFTDQPAVTLEQLTEAKINGSGVFDRLMTSVTAHMDRERSAGRISNAEFAKAYVEFSSGALAASIQFLLQKDQAHWQAITAQLQAKMAVTELVKSRVEFEEIKLRMQTAVFLAENAKAEAARSKMALATAQIEYCTAEYNLTTMLPKQALLLDGQKSQLDAQTIQVEKQTLGIEAQTLVTGAQKLQIEAQTLLTGTQKAQLEAQTDLIATQKLQMQKEISVMDKQMLKITAEISNTEAQTAQLAKQTLQTIAQTLGIEKQTLQTVAQTLGVEAQTAQVQATTTTLLPQQVRATSAGADAQIYQTTYMLPKQVEQLTEQTKLVIEQIESQRAQTMDTRQDGVTLIKGTVGKQKDLHTRQILSYKQDAQVKAARPFIDAWITMKTIDEGTLPPVGFNNTNLDSILAIVRQGNELV
jgi:hypothetical protein